MLKTKFTKKDKRTNLEMEIDHLLEDMMKVAPNSESYTTMAANLEVLYKAKSHERVRRVTPDTVAIVAGNLLGIALVLYHEKANVITTKALGFVIKGRV